MIKKNGHGKNLSKEALVEAYVFPHGLTRIEKEKADQEFSAFRKKRLPEKRADEKLFSRLLQLRFALEDLI